MNLAVKEIRGHDDFAESEGDGDSSMDEDADKKAGIVDSSKLFGVKALKTAKPTVDARDTGKELDAEKVLKAARKVTGGKDDSEDSDDSSDGAGRHAVTEKPKQQPATKATKSSTKEASSGATMVQFGEADLKDFNADKNKLIKETAGPGLEEAELLKSLFVTQ